MEANKNKEFDQFFKEQLSDAEMMPTTNLWAHIEQKLPQKQPRKKPYLLWLVSSSVAAAITLAIWLPKEETVKLHLTASETVAHNEHKNEHPISVIEANIEQEEDKQENKTHQNTQLLYTEGKERNLPKTERIVMPDEPKAVAIIPNQEIQLANSVVENTSIENQLLAQTPNPTIKLVTEKTELAVPTRTRPSIRNLGDLVNLVVDKLDKRDKKIIRFATDEDENSAVVGINIGFIQLNKKI